MKQSLQDFILMLKSDRRIWVGLGVIASILVIGLL